MRVYLGCTVTELVALHESGQIQGQALPWHALTAAMREWYTTDDVEELEYAALCEAAASSLSLLQGHPSGAHRRIVLAVDVPDAQVRPHPTPAPARSSVLVDGVIQSTMVASVHVDEAEVRPIITAAVESLPAALAGDEDAQFAQDEADACDLLWFDLSELGELVVELRDAL